MNLFVDDIISLKSSIFSFMMMCRQHADAMHEAKPYNDTKAISNQPQIATLHHLVRIVEP